MAGATIGGFVEYNLEEITDLHKRRANLNKCAERARTYGIPLIVWPEDKLILVFDDLPMRAFNLSPIWEKKQKMREFIVETDEELRYEIQPGCAYTLMPSSNGVRRVAEYRIESK